MCGICGFRGLKDNRLIKRMLNSIVHRGPDDYGLYSDDHITLGNRRLSIIDLKTGKQPIYNEDKSIVITFNGEIYNYQELCDDLKKKGHKFRTKTDTEVIVHAYEEYGVDCLNMLNGMFAFAIWDKKKKTLFLARDRFGVKPLYYYNKDGRFIFASEIKAILEYSEYDTEYDARAIVDYFTFHYITGKKTYFKNINSLKPGFYLLLSDNKVEVKPYWELRYSPKKNLKIIEEFSELFDNAVKRQLISDVEVGSTLSGGFDSSSIAVFASKKVDKKLSVFTMGFSEGGKYDERSLAKLVSKSINVKVHEEIIEGDYFKNVSKELVYFMDYPLNGTPAYSQYMLSRLISKYVKVVLTGQGGDELFAGYHVFKSLNFLDKVKKNPCSIFKIFKLFKSHEFFRGMYFIGWPFIDSEVRRTGLFVIFSKRERKKLFTKEFYTQIKNYDPGKLEEVPARLPLVQRALHSYIKIYLPTLLLLQDKTAMAYSLETRVPICDNDILDFSLSLSMDDKLKNNELKSVIKRSMKPYLPKELYGSPKKGFPTPFAIWFKKGLKKYLYDLLLSKKAIERRIFNPAYVKKLLDKYTQKSKDNPLSLIGVNKIWSLVITELWFRVFIDGEKDLLREENLKRHKEQII